MDLQAMTYEEAMSQLEKLARQAEDGTLPIDQLAAKLKDAHQLLQFCRLKLTAAEEEVQNLLNASKSDA
ncbi:MAG: exodeoxyribonuclease VII small subunit [Bacteroidaceae bacterium]|nr:exodeoxyribonuclease VII small subunit [Bacteroidaceae bacterium]